MRRPAPDTTFSNRWLTALIGIAVVSFAARLAMGAFGEDFVEPVTAEPSAFSFSAIGHRSLVTFLEERDIPVLLRQDPSGAHGGPSVPELFLEPELGAMRVQDTRLTALLASARRHGAAPVVVLPKWSGTADEERSPPWVDSVGLVDGDRVEEVLHLAGAGDARLVRGAETLDAPCDSFHVSLETPQLLRLEGSAISPVVRCPGGTLIALVSLPEEKTLPGIWIVSDPDVLSNHGLRKAQHEALVQYLFTDLLEAKTVIADEAVHGFRRHISLLRQLARFPLVFFTLHGTLIVGLVLWAGMGRFGKPRPLPPARVAGKEALIENTAQLLADAGHTADTLGRYLTETLRDVAAYHVIPPELPDGERKARLQAISTARGLRLRIADAERALSRLPTRPDASTDQRALRMAIAIHQWRMEMTDERR